MASIRRIASGSSAPTSAGSQRRPAAALLLIAAGPAFLGCSERVEETPRPVDAPTDGRLVVYTVNYPLAYFAERIGAEAVEVRLPAPPGVDPAAWSPQPETIVAYQRADLILLNGAGYAAWLGSATLPASKVVDTSAAFADRYLTVEDAVTHTHGPEGEPAHGDVAFTTWLDPEFAQLQASAIRDALIRLRPEREDDYRSRYESLAADLGALDDGLRAVFTMLGGQPLLFSHPVYQYLVARYGLNARSVHWEPGLSVTAQDLDELAGIRDDHPAGIMLWEAEPLPETRSMLAARGVAAVVFDPCATRPSDGDYLACMKANQRNLEGLL